MTLLTRATIVAAVVASLAVPAAAANDMDTCFDQDGDVAIAACTRLIDSHRYRGKELAAVYGQRGVHFKVAGQDDRAIADYNEAIRIEPTALRYSNRANAKRNTGDFQGAIADLTASINMDSRYPLPYVVRGMIWAYEKHDYDKAIADYSRAITYDPKFTSAYTYRGIAYREKGELERAKADFRTTLTLPAKYTDGKWALEEARKQLEELEAEAPGRKR